MDLTPFLSFLNAHPTAATIVSRSLGVLLTLLFARLAVKALILARRTAIERIQRNHPRGADEATAERALHLETLVDVLFGVARAIIYGFVVLTALSQFGVSVQPFVAGAGLVGAAVALGSQTVVKDFVAGGFILLENHFAIGDQISVSPTLAGVVERMTLRVTVLRDTDGVVHIVPNGTITAVSNRSYRWAGAHVALATPAAAGTTPVREALERAALAAAARDDKHEIFLEAVVVNGPTNIKGTSLEWNLSAKTPVGAGSKGKTLLIEEIVRELTAASISLA